MYLVNRLKSGVKHKYSNAQIFGKNVSCTPDPKTLVTCPVIWRGSYATGSEHFDVPRENAAYHDRFDGDNLLECYRWMCPDLHPSVSASDLVWTNLEILESEPRIRTMYLEISITNVLRSKGLISVADCFLWCFLSPWCLWKLFGVQFVRVLSRKPWIRRKSLGSAPKPRYTF